MHDKALLYFIQLDAVHVGQSVLCYKLFNSSLTHNDICVMQVSTRKEVLELVRAVSMDVWLGDKLIDLYISFHPAVAHL